MFKNASSLGSFGEFVYKKLCESHGMECQRTNFCHTDFLVTKNSEKNKIYVDVKTTQSHRHEYQGKRYHIEIVYESISVVDEVVTLVPDKKSPFKDYGSIEIGNLTILFDDWMCNDEKTKSNTAVIPDDEYMEIRKIFENSSYPKIRFVERGDASQKRWTGSVDNLPGSDATIIKFDATIFIQFGCADFKQNISSITFFPHELFVRDEAPMLEPSKRQKNKGIEKVVDLNSYRGKYPKYYFSSMEKFKDFAKNSL